ncbi:sensor histidine kinase [Paenibacillus soyae]|uniref:Histidine kinase n=1 Tax=Paenibacillus soyae TaxID=2969249 RepID=A0A9X2MY16_9BACL|nr:histidine kinase [Paenibacillus soyae]MCR2807978.1 histidine kinase [Paenibacillus soyae]
MNILEDLLLQMAFVVTLIFAFQLFYSIGFGRSKYFRLTQALLFGVALVLCMTFPVHVTDQLSIDIRIVPLLLGTFYGGFETTLFLSLLILLYRSYLGMDSGFYATTLAVFMCIPIFMYFQSRFLQANKNRRLLIATGLTVSYCVCSFVSMALFIGLSDTFLGAFLLYTVVMVAVVLIFVAMNETIKETLVKSQQRLAEAKDAEIAFLRSQIQPHFLNNALNSIAALCVENPRQAEQLTLNLSQYLRSGLNFKQMDTFTTLENELELTQAYLNIEKVRFGDRLAIEYDIDADPNRLIPPLILQPLVENAIKHGLMSSVRGGIVKISIRETDEKLRFTVEDNGCGMSEAKRQEVLGPDSERRGIGLRNIARRIKLSYDATLQVKSTVGIGTKVLFELPNPTDRRTLDGKSHHRGR